MTDDEILIDALAKWMARRARYATSGGDVSEPIEATDTDRAFARMVLDELDEIMEDLLDQAIRGVGDG